MTHILITVRANLTNGEDRFSYGTPRFIRYRTMHVEITFEVRVNGMRARRMILHMEASETGDDDSLRENLKRNHWGEVMVSVNDVPTPDLTHATVQIDDPRNLLEWLRIAPDDPIFNTQKRLHDQPVRIPAPDAHRRPDEP